MVLDDNNSQIGVEFACRNQAKKIIYWTVTEISVTKVELSTLLAIRVCVFVKKQSPQSAYRVKDFSV